MNTTNPALIHGKRPEEVKYLNKRYWKSNIDLYYTVIINHG